MTSLRQKPKLSLETPVLFRLPDLRVHPAHKPTGWPNAAAANPTNPFGMPDLQALRVDHADAKALTTDDSAAYSAGSIPDGGSNHRATVAAVDNTAFDAVTSNASPARATSSTQALPQPARSWMERFGSRLILVVTLLVIMTAAWVTGQRMPASKQVGTDKIAAEDTATEDLTVASSSSAKNTFPVAQTAPAEQELPFPQPVEPTPPAMLTETNLAAKPALFPSSTSAGSVESNNALPVQEMSATLALEAPRSVHEDDVTPSTGATSTSQLDQLPTSTMASTATTAPSMPNPSFAPSSTFTPVQSVAHDMSAKLPTGTSTPLSLAPATGDQGFYTGQESIETLPAASPSTPAAQTAPPTTPTSRPTAQAAPSSSSSANTAAVTPTSTTPNQLKMDPNVLVPWANEHAMNQSRQQSPTPNPVRNWNDYLPATSNANVRAASASVDLSQPQVGMPASNTAPTFSNSFYSN